MLTKTIQITEVSVEELSEQVAQKVFSKIETYLKEVSKKETDELLSRHEASVYLKVNLVTIHNWTKKEILKAYRVGNRVFYKKAEILAVLEGRE